MVFGVKLIDLPRQPFYSQKHLFWKGIDMLNVMKNTYWITMISSIALFMCFGVVDIISSSQASDYGVKIEFILFGIYMCVTALACLLVLLIVVFGNKYFIVAIAPVIALFSILVLGLGANGKASNSHVAAYFPRATIQNGHFRAYDLSGKNGVYLDSNFTKIVGQDFSDIPDKFVSLKTVGYINTPCWDNKGFCWWVNYFLDKRRFVVEVQDAETKKTLGNIIVYRVPFLVASGVYQERTDDKLSRTHISKTEAISVKSQIENAHAISGEN